MGLYGHVALSGTSDPKPGKRSERGSLLMKIRMLLCLLASIGMLAPMGLAQSFFGSIVGTVTDTSGAVIPDAKVTLSSSGTAERRTAQSDSSGNYEFVSLVPGMYQIDVEKGGFKRLSRSSIQVEVAGVVRVDATMQAGDITQTLEVNAESSLIQTEESSVSQAVSGRGVTEMPLNGRNIMNLVALVPGVVPGGSFMGTPMLDQSGTVTNPPDFASYYAGGGLPNTGSSYLDGVTVIVGFLHSTSLVVTQDAIQEFRVQVNNIEPEFGQAANGVISFTTKTGSNQFHGTAYEYLRNRVLNANTFFGNKSGLPRAAFTQNQFGANLGGPVIKDKTFFFLLTRVLN